MIEFVVSNHGQKVASMATEEEAAEYCYQRNLALNGSPAIGMSYGYLQWPPLPTAYFRYERRWVPLNESERS